MLLTPVYAIPRARRRLVTATPLALVTVLATVAAIVVGPFSGAIAAAGQNSEPSACAVVTAPPAAVTSTTIGTIEQAYRCILDHYVDGPSLDDRTLLAGAFASFTEELDRRGVDQPDATMPALTGDRDQDWAAFSAVYQQVTGHLPAQPALQQALAAAAMTGMVASLHDNHVGWARPVYPPGWTPGQVYGFGFTTAPFIGLAIDAPQETLPPLFITGVLGGPAAQHDLRPGDVITSVNGVPPFVDGQPVPGVMDLLSEQYPRAAAVRLTVQRPSTGRVSTMTLTPALFQPTAEAMAPVTVSLLHGDIADVRLSVFAPGVADQALGAIATLARTSPLRGVVLDLRGNGGGSPAEMTHLLSALIHGQTWSYDCDATNKCSPNWTDDTVPLLGLPVAVLIDRDCASACDAFAGAVKDLRLGSLVGTRTAGSVSGIADGYLLDDNSVLNLPATHQRGADGEIINGIGVAPDYNVPLTAFELSTGRDPAMEKAVALLTR